MLNQHAERAVWERNHGERKGPGLQWEDAGRALDPWTGVVRLVALRIGCSEMGPGCAGLV